MKKLALFAAAIALSASATSAEWRSSVGARGAQAIVETGGMTFSLGCNPGETAFYVTLHGGPFPGMKNADDENDSMMMWIEAPDGRTARHPLDGHYFGPEDAFVGRFLTSDIILEQFAGGAEMMLTAVTGDTILRTDMKGTRQARSAFRSGCGL